MFDSLIAFVKKNIVLFDIIFLSFVNYFSFNVLLKVFLSLMSFLKWVLALL